MMQLPDKILRGAYTNIAIIINISGTAMGVIFLAKNNVAN